MRRRDFISVLGGAAAVWPLAARAQLQRMRRIGVLVAHDENDREGHAEVDAFLEGLRRVGWAEGRTGSNIHIDYRWAKPDDVEMRTRFAEELIALRPDLIVSHGTPNTAALLQQTRSIPIIFLSVSDPIGSGFVASFPRPGGNATGFIPMEPTMASKWLELLKEIAPHVDRVGLLFNPESAPYVEYYLQPFKAAAASLAMEAVIAPISHASEESTMAALAHGSKGGLVVMPDTFTSSHRADIVELAARYRLPAIYPFRFFAEVGGLLSYGNDRRDAFRRAAGYVDRILKGEKPSELPVQAPVKFDLVINLKTAKALGLDVPLFLQQRADEVIE